MDKPFDPHPRSLRDIVVLERLRGLSEDLELFPTVNLSEQSFLSRLKRAVRYWLIKDLSASSGNFRIIRSNLS